jgi:transglutaminase-like putative cysteine protease
MYILRNWQRNAALLLWTVFLLQFVVWFSEYWYTQTEIIVKSTLWTILIIEILFPLHWLIRRSLQLCAIAVIHGLVLEFQPVDVAVDSFLSFWNYIYHVVIQTSPFIWFSIGAWLIYLIMVWWVQTKAKLYYVVILSVALFALVDSFSYYILWDQVALLVSSGLLLVTILHFEAFKQKHPASWQYFADYPASIAAPIILIVSIVMIIGVNMPSVRPLLTDPYTVWKHMQGETVPTFGKGFEGFEASNLRNRDASSGYRRDDSQLGSGFNFDYSEVMTVSTSHRGYWRGESRSFYNGSGWELIETGTQQNITLESALIQDESLNTSLLETIEVEQNVTMLNEEQYPVLFGALSIQALQQLSDESELSSVFWFPDQSVLRLGVEFENYPKTYQLVSQIPVIREEGLREASTDAADPEFMAQYLQLPENLPNRVIELAQNITGEETNPYDKVKQIETYLHTEFPYTNQPDLSKGTSKDFVDRFLFEIQEGYCDYYSTSMVVLARSLGIPARWVKGYSPGVLPEDEFEIFRYGEEIDPDGGGTYTVRNADAHSWVEVYFDGFGWIPFEPTSGFTLPVIYPEDELPELLPSVTDTDASAAEEGTAGRNTTVTIAALLAVLFISAIWLVRKRRKALAWWHQIRGNRKNLHQDQKVVSEFERFLKFARKKGFTREEYETVRETIARWVSHNKWLLHDLEKLQAIFEKAKYSKLNVTQEEFHNALRICKKLREEIK